MVKRRQSDKRPSYHEKSEIILAAIRRMVYEGRWYQRSDFGHTMAQIAEEAGYSRSQRFMETLYSMCDDGLLEKEEYKSDNAHIPTRVVFRLPASRKQTTLAC